MKLIKKLVFLILIIFIVSFLDNKFNLKERFLKIIYPIKYSEYVERYSNENEIDKMLIYSIIKAESNFNPNVKSESGAIGLMQIMFETALELEPNITEDDLYMEDINIKLGIKYFCKLLKYYNNNINLAIIAYNAGIGNVDRWIKDGVILKDGSNIENVPFKETNNYARKILNNYKLYNSLY